jgi:hypothetical protein
MHEEGSAGPENVRGWLSPLRCSRQGEVFALASALQHCGLRTRTRHSQGLAPVALVRWLVGDIQRHLAQRGVVVVERGARGAKVSEWGKSSLLCLGRCRG